MGLQEDDETGRGFGADSDHFRGGPVLLYVCLCLKPRPYSSHYGAGRETRWMRWIEVVIFLVARDLQLITLVIPAFLFV